MFRVSILAVLGSLTVGCASRPTVKSAADLTQDLTHREERVRLAAAEQLAEVGADQAAAAVRALTGALKDESSYVRQASVRSLGAQGPRAKDAVPALQKALKDSDEGVRLDARDALKKIQGP